MNIQLLHAPTTHLSIAHKNLHANLHQRQALTQLLSDTWGGHSACYLLISPNRQYIGQTDNIQQRITKHHAHKHWWTHVFIFHSNSEPWTKTQCLEIEHLLIRHALSLHIPLDNQVLPAPVVSSAHDQTISLPAVLTITHTLQLWGLWPPPALKIQDTLSQSPSLPPLKHLKPTLNRTPLQLIPSKTKKNHASLILEGRRHSASTWQQLLHDVATYLLLTYGIEPFIGNTNIPLYKIAEIPNNPPPNTLYIQTPEQLLALTTPTTITSKKKLLADLATIVSLDLDTSR